ncbi:MAG: DUF3618 domain-containing protein [Planctomycetes bacterium]|nr:DUF3618 domain-containing protein [Planctomycetota bacterium]
MDQEPDALNQDPEQIRQQIEETRSSLTEKLETLEGTVRGTVQEAKASVEDTIETVKTKVQETVATVKRTFDLKYQVQQHPWSMTGGSVVAGFLLGSLARPRSSHRGSSTFAASRSHAPGVASSLSGGSSPPTDGASSGSSFLAPLRQQFDEEIHQVKALALGTLFGVLRDYVNASVPPHLAPEVTKIIDNVTTKLGGKLMPSPVLETSIEEAFRRRQGTESRAASGRPTL